MIQYLSTQVTPALKFLSLQWKLDIAVALPQDEIDGHDGWDRLGSSHPLGRGPNRPQLRQVEFHGLPSVFVFRHTPVVSDLANLTLVGSSIMPPIQGISTLLLSNPQLEFLHLGMGAALGSRFDPHISLAGLQARLPQLRSLVLNTVTSYGWGLQLLQIIDAPRLEYFKLQSSEMLFIPDADLNPQALFRHIVAGRIHGTLQYSLPPEKLEERSPNSGSIFPSLRHFDIQDLNAENQKPLLEAFPSITHVALNRHALCDWSECPSLLPNVSHITYNGCATKDFLASMLPIALQRADTGKSPLFPDITIATKTLSHEGAIVGRPREGNDDHVVDILRRFANKVDLHRYSQDVFDSDDEIYDNGMFSSSDEGSSIFNDED
ncbi:hypothetical protein CTheo_7737 [Ceratobasidium theobromae]|uniref:Uncharacterized protein n=1 Tax=Ceratobasidium theobromae TaxID=1582974 RepID=A0A5N5QBS3_9AGAM|nr:hypothetical protein CTheo_7737 [Ceratobasidium theobromae]